MLEGKMKPLEIAARVLTIETLKGVARSPFTSRGWAIADRWALNSPTALKALEGQGWEVLRARLLSQQQAETAALLANAESLDSGTAEHEVLSLAEIDTELA